VFYWFLKTFIVGPFANSVFRPWSRGDENVPQTGAVIFASNHLSFIDSVFLPLAVKRLHRLRAHRRPDAVVLPGDQPASDRPLRRQGV